MRGDQTKGAGNQENIQGKLVVGEEEGGFRPERERRRLVLKLLGFVRKFRG